MKTCKNCFHYDVCGKKPPEDTPFSAEQYCPNDFKDKELIVELPCRIDDQIYILKGRYKGKKCIKTEIVKADIDCFTIGEAKRPIADICDEEGDFFTCLGAEDFYLCYEAAEQAMKEGAGNV